MTVTADAVAGIRTVRAKAVAPAGNAFTVGLTTARNGVSRRKPVAMSKSDRDGRKGGTHKTWWKRTATNCDWCRTGIYRVIDIRKERREAQKECRRWLI